MASTVGYIPAYDSPIIATPAASIFRSASSTIALPTAAPAALATTNCAFPMRRRIGAASDRPSIMQARNSARIQVAARGGAPKPLAQVEVHPLRQASLPD